MRDVVFIGHANPEDNEQTKWLQAKLINEGYNAQSDLTFLTGGEKDYWQSLQVLLDQSACKYLLILTRHTFNKEGVKDEWEHVRSLEKDPSLTDFIMGLRFDDVPFDIRIGLNRKNLFDFSRSWDVELKRLLHKLRIDNVPKSPTADLSRSLSLWLQNPFTTSVGVIDRDERFYSNWISIEGHPAKLCFFQYANEVQAERIAKINGQYPVVQNGSLLVSFNAHLNNFLEAEKIEIEPSKIVEIDVREIINGFESDTLPRLADVRNSLVSLLKQAFHSYLLAKGLSTYEFSGKTTGFFYKKGSLEKDKISFTYQSKPKTKNLVGEYLGSHWHYCVSCRPMLHPFFAFCLKAHIVFTDDGVAVWENKTKMHKARRSKGKNFHNREWRDLLLAFLATLSNGAKAISIPVAERKNLMISGSTIEFHSTRGYREPTDENRLVPLDEIYEDELGEGEE